MNPTNVLVTGGAGYIGSHTAKALASAGFRPIVLDNLTSGNRWAVQWGPFVLGDIADKQLVRRTIREYNIGSAVHLAASAYVGESTQNPRKYFENNVVKSLSLLDILLDCEVDKLVFSSSCATYGIPQTELIGEDHSQKPINPYGETKFAVERACHWYDQAYGFRTICLRYFNAAGADLDGEIGESHSPETHLIPLAIGSALGVHPALQIYGTSFPTSDGTAVRDFIHVVDVAAAHVDALRHLIAHGKSVNLNIGTGTGVSVRQIVDVVERATGKKLITHSHEARQGDPPTLIARPDLAMEVLGWTPKVSGIGQIVSSAMSWHSREMSKCLVETR